MKERTARRLAAVGERLAALDCPLLVLGPGMHMHWLLGYHPLPCERLSLLLLGPRGAALVSPALNAPMSRARLSLPIETWADGESPLAALRRALATVGGEGAGAVALDESMRADFALALFDALGGRPQHRYAAEVIGPLRQCKDAAECAAITAVGAIADRAMAAAFAAIAPGVSERQVAAQIADTFAADGARCAFAIVAAGDNGAYPHHAASDRCFAAGDAVLIDLGGERDAFYSDITRVGFLGTAPAQLLAVQRVVEAALCAALVAARPGARAGAVDAAARAVIGAAGYGAHFNHRTGHGLGLDVHEGPDIAPGVQTRLEPGMVFTLEPGIYLEGRFGVRLEELVILGEDGPRVVSTLGREARELPG